jgi:hypothetical protein
MGRPVIYGLPIRGRSAVPDAEDAFSSCLPCKPPLPASHLTACAI